MRYFAYGSNMLVRRLTALERVPSARAVAIGYVEGCRLSFDKIGLDGSGKCDSELTNQPADRVYGVVFDIAPAEKLALDRIECAGNGYAVASVSVATPGHDVEAFTYVAQRKSPDLLPFHWYKALVVAGAAEHGLPTAYIADLRAVASIEDTDDERRAHYEALLGRV